MIAAPLAHGGLRRGRYEKLSPAFEAGNLFGFVAFGGFVRFDDRMQGVLDAIILRAFFADGGIGRRRLRLLVPALGAGQEHLLRFYARLRHGAKGAGQTPISV